MSAITTESDPRRGTEKSRETKSSSRRKDGRGRDRCASAATAPPAPSPAVTVEERVEEEDWEANRSRVESLCMSGLNHLCADCGEPGTRWASVNHGVFVCIRCSGIHRSLGVHVSKVKSTNMDKWTAAEVALMEAVGNKRGSALYEVNLGSARRPSAASSDAELRAFIEHKYAQRAYASDNLKDTLKRFYKQAGYGKYQRARGGPSRVEATSSSTAAAASEGVTGGVDKRQSAKAMREQAVRALYGDSAAEKMAAQRQAPRRAASGQRGSGEPSTVASTGTTAVGGNARKGKTLHGSFGVVNVAPEEYEARWRAVLSAFGVEEAGEMVGQASAAEEERPMGATDAAASVSVCVSPDGGAAEPQVERLSEGDEEKGLAAGPTTAGA